MALKEIKDIHPGEVVEEDVLNNQNNILVPKETPLTEKHLRTLKAWGISVLHIKDTINPILSPSNKEEDLAKIQLLIQKKFKLNTEPHPFLEHLQELILTRYQNNQENS